MPPITRARLKQALLTAARTALDTARAAHAAAVEGATHSEAKAENDKDTRGLEQSYLARGHAARVEELEGVLGALTHLPERLASERAGLGAIVTVEDDDGAAARYYLAPWGGGVHLPGDVVVVTPSSPVGAALLGKEEGDELDIARPGGRRTVTVTAIG